jgi:hypothetical protein
MKRLLVSLVMVMAVTIPIETPAHALFGLSKCEKVKKQIDELEGLIKSFPDMLRVSKVNRNSAFTIGSDEIEVLTAKSQKLLTNLNQNDPITQIWKLGFNNPKCFSNTQKLRIETLKNETVKSYFGGLPDRVWKTDPFCKSALKNVLSDDYAWNREKCSTLVQKWYWTQQYQSIYSY